MRFCAFKFPLAIHKFSKRLYDSSQTFGTLCVHCSPFVSGRKMHVLFSGLIAFFIVDQ